MNKKNLIDIFTKDTKYNYHLIRTNDPIGHLLYLMKNGSQLTTDSLEFTTTRIAEELVKDCGVEIEKIAPGIFFTNENNTEKLKYELNEKLTENNKFSFFIESIKDKYRILEIKDSLLYKKDPEAYEEAKKKEHLEKQKELLEQLKNQIENSKIERENALLSYNNNLIKLIRDHFDDVIEFEQRDFNFQKEIELIISNLIDDDTWLKINDIPFSCNIEIISMEREQMKVFLTDNNLLYTATLKFDKTKLTAENFEKIEKIPNTIMDYDFLSFLYDIDTNSIQDWEFKNHTEKFEYIINLLVPILKEEKKKKQEEIIQKLIENESKDEDENEYNE